MQETNHLSDRWEHTITKVFKLDPKYKVDQMIRQWVIYNKLDDFNSLLNHIDEDFSPNGGCNLSYYQNNGDSVVKMMPTTPLQMLDNLRWYIQHLINESGYLYDDDESNYPLSEDKWMLLTHGEFMKYVLFSLHRMTPNQMKMNPIKPIIKVKTNVDLEKEEGESIIEERNLQKHLKNCQKNKILHLTYILKIKKIQNQLKHLKFIMFRKILYQMK